VRARDDFVRGMDAFVRGRVVENYLEES